MTEQVAKKFNFTKAGIESLAPTDKRVFYYDASTRGLTVLVEPTGRKTFYLYRKVGKTTKQLKLGVFPDMTVAQARDKAGAMNGALVMGEDPERARQGKRGETVFAEVFAWFLEAHSRPRKITWKQDEWFYKTYLKPEFGAVPMSLITKAEVRRWHAALAERKSKPIANRSLILLSSVFTQALAHDMHKGEHPCRAVEPFHAQSRDRRLMPGEFEDFFAAVRADASQAMKDFVFLALFTGQRKNNLLSMRWEDIDLDNHRWKIPRTKNGRSLTVPLGSEELGIIERRKVATKGSPWVFPGKGTDSYMTNPQQGWKRILDRANEARVERGDEPMKELRIHDLRRTLGSYMADTGASLHIIGKTLGHESSQATEIYARLSLDPVREAKAKAIQAMKGEG